MAELPFVVPGEAINSTTFGNPVVVRVLSRYPDATARDFAVPTPVPGDFAYLTTSSELQVYDGTTWETYAEVADVDAGLDLKVAKVGDTMTGPLQVPDGVRTATGLQVGAPGRGLYVLGTSIGMTAEGADAYLVAVSPNQMQVIGKGALQMQVGDFFNVQVAYDQVTNSAPNMNINSSGAIRRSTAVAATEAEVDDLRALIVALQAQVDAL